MSTHERLRHYRLLDRNHPDEPLARCRHIGATSPYGARGLDVLNPDGNLEWDRLLWIGRIREASPGRYYATWARG